MMEVLENPSPAEIETTIAKARAAMPAYSDLLAFYEAIFKVQAERRNSISPASIPIDASRAAIAHKEGFPLATPAGLPGDIAHGADLLGRLCRAVEGLKAEPARSAAAIGAALDSGRLEARTLLEARLEMDAARLEAMAAQLAVAEEVLIFFADQSLTPLRIAARRQLADYLKTDQEWPNGCCPICGSPPALGDLAENGRRHLNCGACGYRWPCRRVHCVQCGQADPARLFYFYSDEEPAYRVDACDGCRHYIKTVDLRRLGRPFFAPLEQVLTTHLDLLAAEQGLSPVTGSSFE